MTCASLTRSGRGKRPIEAPEIGRRRGARKTKGIGRLTSLTDCTTTSPTCNGRAGSRALPDGRKAETAAHHGGTTGRNDPRGMTEGLPSPQRSAVSPQEEEKAAMGSGVRMILSYSSSSTSITGGHTVDGHYCTISPVNMSTKQEKLAMLAMHRGTK